MANEENHPAPPASVSPGAAGEVPREPTQAMVDAMQKAAIGWEAPLYGHEVRAIYRAALSAAPPPPMGGEPVARGEWLLSPLPQPAERERVYGGHGNEIVHEWFNAHQMREYARQEVYRAEGMRSTSPMGGAAEGWVMVPKEFIQGFHTLAHNYSLRAEPPEFYRGTEGDAFSRAYRQCGEALGKLRALLAAAPQEGSQP